MEVTDLFSKLRLIFHDPDEPGEMEVVCVCVRACAHACACAHMIGRGRGNIPLLMACGCHFFLITESML